MDWLGQRFAEQERSPRAHLTLRVLQHANRTAVPANMEVLQGLGGTVVYRRRFPTVLSNGS